jgi:hypothetical protein
MAAGERTLEEIRKCVDAKDSFQYPLEGAKGKEKTQRKN